MPLICVCSPKGGVGKTTLAANLAYSLARTGSKVWRWILMSRTRCVCILACR
jgi:MinD-like ATPase involved in chromosome partitioning or flagellar assembly